MHWLRLSLAATAALVCAQAQAALVFLPHIGEYGKAVPGQYAGLSLYHASYNKYFGQQGQEFEAVGGGAYINNVFFATSFVGNLFRDTDIPFLQNRAQSCAFGMPVVQLQGKGSVLANADAVGIKGGHNGIGDLLMVCSIQDVTRVIGPGRGHLQLSAWVKFPIGSYDRDALYNMASNYWTYAPQLALHADIGHMVVDAAATYQFNGNNDEPYAAGDVPTRPADWYNGAINLGWKLNYRWWVDLGFAYNHSRGPNYYDQFKVQPARQPIPFSAICGGIPAVCNMAGTAYLETRPGPYADGGMMSQVATAGIYYTYRSSAIVNVRVGKAIAGRGSEITALYDVCTTSPCGPSSTTLVPGSPFSFKAPGVGESASVVSQPFYELRFIFPLSAF